MKRVLVTGACGFLGSRLCKVLAEKGVKVVAFIANRKSNATKAFGSLDCKLRKEICKTFAVYNSHEKRELPFAECFDGDILKPEDLEKALRGCDAVYHLAAQSAPKVSEENEKEDFEINVVGTRNALEAAQKAGCKVFVFTSSSYVYGDNGKTPVTEHSKLAPAKVYGKHKLAAEECCRAFAKKGKMRVVIARLFNAYGPGQKGRVVPDLIGKAIAAKGDSFEVLGNCADFRDLLFVDDALRALVLLAEKGENNSAYNVASGTVVEIKGLAEMIANAVGNGKKPLCSKFDEKTAYGAVADVSKLKALGWRPEVSLEEGLEKCVQDARTAK